MAVEPLLERNRDAAENQRTAGHETMQVVPVTDPDRRGTTRRAEQPRRHLEIIRCRDLQVAGVAIDEMHVMTGLLGEHCLVRRIRRRRREPERVTQHADSKRLRRLREEDLLSRECVVDDARRVTALHCVPGLERRNRGAVLGRRCHGSLDERR